MIKKIIYTCNHIEEIEDKIGGEKKVKSLCPDCFNKKYKADSMLGIKLAKKYNYPLLVGTENQKMAGEAIRYRWITFLEYLKESGQPVEIINNLEIILKSVISSIFYVKKRNCKQNGILETKIEDKLKINWQVIYPVNKTENNCALYFYQNEDYSYFIGFEGTKNLKMLALFHTLNFKWKNPIWEKIYNTEEEAINVFSALVNNLLSYDYIITVPAITKNYIKEMDMEEFYKDILISEKLNLDMKIVDIKNMIFDVENGRLSKEQISQYLLNLLKRDLQKLEKETEELEEKKDRV